MSLTTPEEVESAVCFLHSCHADVYSLVGGQSVTVRLKGIASMQTNIKKANVIYALPDESEGNLRSLCGNADDSYDSDSADYLHSRFKEAKFLGTDKYQDQAVKVRFCLLVLLIVSYIVRC